MPGDRVATYTIDSIINEVDQFYLVIPDKHCDAGSYSLRILFEPEFNEPEFKQRFLMQAHQIRQLVHPNIQGTIERAAVDGQLFMVSEFAESVTLASILRSHEQGLPANDVVEVCSAVARALDYAHDRGVPHGAVSLDNIILTSSRRILLTNFGLGDDEGSSRNDQNSLAVVLYQLFTGLFDLTENAPTPHERRPDLPDKIQEIIAKAFHGDYRTSGELAAEVRQVFDGYDPDSLSSEENTAEVMPTDASVNFVAAQDYYQNNPILANGEFVNEPIARTVYQLPEPGSDAIRPPNRLSYEPVRVDSSAMGVNYRFQQWLKTLPDVGRIGNILWIYLVALAILLLFAVIYIVSR